MSKNILIVGLGLIGSSLALCVRRQYPDHQIFGVDPNEHS